MSSWADAMTPYANDSCGLLVRTRFFGPPALLLLLSAEPVLASADFPRGPGYYYNLWKIGSFLFVYFVWISICGWVSRDIEKRQIPPRQWTFLFLAVGLLGLAGLWIAPFFWPTLALFAGCIVLAACWYIKVRDRIVDAEERILTSDNFRRLLHTYFWIKLPSRTVPKKKKASGEPRETPAGDIRLIAHGQDRDDQDRLARAKASKGYRAALELIGQALADRASDVCLQPVDDILTLRFRIDGVMYMEQPLAHAISDAVINIFKLVAHIDSDEEGKPQSGVFFAEVDGRQIEFRVAATAVDGGPGLLIHVLDPAQRPPSLGQLGMRDKMRDQVLSIIKKQHGLFLVSGPPGCGKNATIHACLHEIDRYQQNVITLENPVEYRLDHVTQIDADRRTSKSHVGQLRSLLRKEEPDVIFVEELLDRETADTVCQAAQSGLLVFSTLDADDCLAALARLIELGIEPAALSTALSGILAQRLVRLLCTACRVRYSPNPDLLQKAGLPAEKIKHFFRPPDPVRGRDPCQVCAGTGYRTRTGIFELLVVNERIRQLLAENADLRIIEQEAAKKGLRHLSEEGMRLVIEGRTSLAELQRVSKGEERS